VIWGVLIFAETLSPLQWVGAVVVLAGVGAMTTRASLTRAPERKGRTVQTVAR
jgi:drug/metabolite transporter (DMT)-like permease